MAEENVPAPTRTDEQLVLVKARLPIGKSNLLMDLQKLQKNHIFRISVDIFALGITPKDSTQPFVAPPAGDLPKPRVIPYCRFIKLIICYLGGRHNIHKRPQSPLQIMTDDYSLSNLKFVPKGELDERYLEMVARKPRQATTMTDEEGRKKKKAPPAGKYKQPARAKQPALAKQTKLVKEKTSKPSPSKKIRKGKVMKVRKEKRPDHLVDEKDEEGQPAPEPQVEYDEYNLQRGIQMSLESFQAPIAGVVIHEPASVIPRKLPDVKGKGKGITTDEQVAQSLLDLQQPKKMSHHDNDGNSEMQHNGQS
nr:hypothetical protein [Tanacetum cinerariifolium]